MAVSVRRFIQDDPELFKATVGFVERLENTPDPVMQLAKRQSSVNEKIAWILLGTTLFQECSFSEIFGLMNALCEKFPGGKLWTLPVPRASDIDECIKAAFKERSWSIAEHASGIVWSVGYFVRNHKNLREWVKSRTPMEMWRDLGEIYFMGKNNPRPKACAAIYRLLAPAPVGLGLQALAPEKLPPLPLTMGARRFLSILGPAKDDEFSTMSPREKQKMQNDFCSALASKLPPCSVPESAPYVPYVAAHALQFFLENGKDGFICRAVTDKCRKCPLYEYCDYAECHDR